MVSRVQSKLSPAAYQEMAAYQEPAAYSPLAFQNEHRGEVDRMQDQNHRPSTDLWRRAVVAGLGAVRNEIFFANSLS